MQLLSHHIRTFFTASLIAVFIVACGSGSGDGVDASAQSSNSPSADESTVNQPVSQEILGPDIDSDGIRDDVQMMIESEYGGELEVMRAFKRMAITDRRILQVVHEQSQVNALSREQKIALRCWLWSFDSYDERSEAIRLYRQSLYDTPDRQIAGLLLDRRLMESRSGASRVTREDCTN